MSARVNEFRDAVVAAIRQKMPDLRDCDTQFGRLNLDEIERSSMRLPAVRFAVLKAAVPHTASGGNEVRLSCAAFVVAEGRERFDEAWAMGEALATMLHSSQTWGMTRVSGPSSVEMQPVVLVEVNRRGIAVMAVEWTQELRRLGENIFDADGVLLTELYINGEEIELPSPGDEGDGDE